MVAAAVAAAYARFAIGPVQETMRVALSLSDNQMALLQGPALALPMVLAAVPIGFLIDRYSRARLLVFFSVLNVSGALLTAAAVNFGLLFLARCVAGLAVAAVSTTAFALIGDLYAPAQRGRATMMVVIGQYAGMSAAFAVGGVLVAHFASAPQGWHRAMFALAAPLVPVTLLLLATREPPRAGSATGGSRREPFARSFGHAALPSSQP
jgi:MFS family permease